MTSPRPLHPPAPRGTGGGGNRGWQVGPRPLERREEKTRSDPGCFTLSFHSCHSLGPGGRKRVLTLFASHCRFTQSAEKSQKQLFLAEFAYGGLGLIHQGCLRRNVNNKTKCSAPRARLQSSPDNSPAAGVRARTLSLCTQRPRRASRAHKSRYRDTCIARARDTGTLVSRARSRARYRDTCSAIQRHL